LGGSPIFQRSGSARYSANNSYNYGQTSPAYQQENHKVVSSSQGNADCAEPADECLPAKRKCADDISWKSQMADKYAHLFKRYSSFLVIQMNTGLIFSFKTKNFTQSFWSYRIVMTQVGPNLPPIYLYLRQKLSQFSH
jgi:hypothetical protein